MGLRDLFIKQAEEQLPQRVSRAQAISLPAVYANTELLAIL